VSTTGYVQVHDPPTPATYAVEDQVSWKLSHVAAEAG
jgi:hypothetical protein